MTTNNFSPSILSDGWKKTWVNKPATAATEPALCPHFTFVAHNTSLEWLKPGLDILYLACASSGTLLALIFCPYFSLGSASIAQQLLELILTLTSIPHSKELHFSHHGWLSEDTHWFWPRKEFIVDVDCTRGVQRQGHNTGIVQCCLVSQSPSLAICIYTLLYSSL